MSENHRSGKLVELIGSATVKEAFHKKVGQRRWGVALVTLGISLLGLWLMIDIVGARGWTPLEVLEVGLFGILFANLAFGFTQAFLGFLVLAEGHEPLKITNTLDETTPLASTAVVMPVFNEDAETVFGNVQALVPVASAKTRTRFLRFLCFERFDRSGESRRRGVGLVGYLPSNERIWQNSLSPSKTSGESKKRKHRGFLPPLGTSPSLYGRA